MNKIKVVIKEPFTAPRRVWISDTLENLQSIVGGCIETVTFSTLKGNVVMIVNEEGKFGDFKANFRFGYDMIFGTAIFCGVDGEEFADLPMSLKELEKAFGEMGVAFVKEKTE